MIVIKDSDFEMVQVKTSPFFNLSILTPINEGKENERFEMKDKNAKESKTKKSMAEAMLKEVYSKLTSLVPG